MSSHSVFLLGVQPAKYCTATVVWRRQSRPLRGSPGHSDPWRSASRGEDRHGTWLLRISWAVTLEDPVQTGNHSLQLTSGQCHPENHRQVGDVHKAQVHKNIQFDDVWLFWRFLASRGGWVAGRFKQKEQTNKPQRGKKKKPQSKVQRRDPPPQGGCFWEQHCSHQQFIAGVLPKLPGNKMICVIPKDKCNRMDWGGWTVRAAGLCGSRREGAGSRRGRSSRDRTRENQAERKGHRAVVDGGGGLGGQLSSLPVEKHWAKWAPTP